MKESFNDRITEYLNSKELPSHDFIFELLNSAVSVLENEITNYRKASASKSVGGLLDFLENPLPTIIVPDLHARTFFLKNIFDYQLPKGFLPDDFEGTTVLDGIKAGKLRIICIGDAMHSELRGRQRWLEALNEFKKNISLYSCYMYMSGYANNCVCGRRTCNLRFA